MSVQCLPKKRLVLKVTGTLAKSRMFLSLLNTLSVSFEITVICGGGDQANAKLRAMGYKPRFDENGVRVAKTAKELAIVIQSHIDTANRLQRLCDESSIPVTVYPSLFYGNINADTLLEMCIASGWYDKFALVTLPERIHDKIKRFSGQYTQNFGSFHFIPLDP